MRPAIIILGMHRSGTSCLAGMIAAANLGSAGDTIRNWDNVRGHHEMLDLVRLDESVLAYSGGNYLTPPGEVKWTAAHAAQRDRLLATSIDGRPPLLKDPRMLLVLPFWRASAIPFRAIAIVRHPLAVARSLAAWRELPLADGVALWLGHGRALTADRDAHGTPVIDFDRPRDDLIAAVAAELGCDPAPLAAAFDEQLIHHDGEPPAPGTAATPAISGLDDALALYRALGGQGGSSRSFPRAELAAFERQLAAGDLAGARSSARAAIGWAIDRGAVLVPMISALLRVNAHAEAIGLVDHANQLDRDRTMARASMMQDTGLLELLRGKVLLAMHDHAGALRHLEAACAVAAPLYQARALLPQALRGAGRDVEARVALERVAREALYPHGPLATLAEWSALDGDRTSALAIMQRAVEAAPVHRRGRLRTRRAEWLRAADDLAAARAELERAIEEDPAYARSRELLGQLTR